jgi:hypothetical protein
MNVQSTLQPQVKKTRWPNRSDNIWPSFERDLFLSRGQNDLAWKKYCGFVDFSLDEYYSIQKLLLKEQIQIIKSTALGGLFMGEQAPETLDEFRTQVPLTVLEDYHDIFESGGYTATDGTSPLWISTDEKGEHSSRIPVSSSAIKMLVDDFITALILASARTRGEVRIEPLDKFLIESGSEVLLRSLDLGLQQRLECVKLTAGAETRRNLPYGHFKTGIQNGLDKGIDFIISSSDMIYLLGENIDHHVIRTYFNRPQPGVFSRFLKAWLICRMQHRSALARDLWKVKGIISLDNGTPANSERIERAWGCKPLEIYYRRETGLTALQTWNKKGLTFIPYRNFYEFIPLKELGKETSNRSVTPVTHLMNELVPGEIYELVITNFHGGPFLRYRGGFYFRVNDLKDTQTGIKLPQFITVKPPELNNQKIK